MSQTIEQILTRQNKELREQVAELNEEIRRLNDLLGRSPLTLQFAHQMGIPPLCVKLLDLLTKKELVSKDAAMSWLYGHMPDAPDEKIIDVLICKIRKPFRTHMPEGIDFISTHWGRGYALTRQGRELIEALDAAAKSVA